MTGLRLLRVLSVLVALGLMCSPASANLVQNGDFATGDLTDWTTGNVSISGNYGGHVTQVVNGPEAIVVRPSDIGFGAEIATDIGFGALTQSLATMPGHSYRVHYIVRVLFDGVGFGAFVAMFDNVGYMGADPRVFMPFPPYPPLPPGSPIQGLGGGPDTPVYLPGTYDETFIATATGDITPIEFASNFQGDFFVTQISVDPVPAPSTLTLIGLGVLILGWRSRSRRP